MIEVLIVEDNQLYRRTLANLINNSANMICAHTFESAEEALKKIEKTDLAPEIVLMDIGLPGMNGVECIPPLRKLLPEAKIIMLTIHDDNDNIFKAICNGASGYLLKDSPSSKILESIHEVQEGGAPMNANIAQKIVQMFKQLTLPSGDYDLSAREKEILNLMVDGLSKKEIANDLFISYHTVDAHIRHIYEKLEVHTRSGAVAKALKEKLL